MLKDIGINASIHNLLWIKPFSANGGSWEYHLKKSKHGGLVLDDDYEQGVASSIAHRMMIKTDKKVHTLGLEHRTAGFHEDSDNLPPSPKQIVDKVRRIYYGKG